MDLLNKIEQIILNFERLIALLSGLIMLISVALQVIFRYVFRISVPWTEEMAIMSFIVLVFYGAILASYHDRHLGIKNLVDRLTGQSYKIVWFIRKIILSLFLIMVMLVFSFPMVIEGLNQTYTISRIPLFYIFLQIPIFGLLTVFHIIMSILRKDYLKELLIKNKET